MFYRRQVFFLKAQTAPWRLTDVGWAAAAPEDDDEDWGPAGTPWHWGPGGHICAGSFGI